MLRLGGEIQSQPRNQANARSVPLTCSLASRGSTIRDEKAVSCKRLRKDSLKKRRLPFPYEPVSLPELPFKSIRLGLTWSETLAI